MDASSEQRGFESPQVEGCTSMPPGRSWLVRWRTKIDRTRCAARPEAERGGSPRVEDAAAEGCCAAALSESLTAQLQVNLQVAHIASAEFDARSKGRAEPLDHLGIVRRFGEQPLCSPASEKV